MLGFKDLSDASRDLEQACLTHSAVGSVLDRSRGLCRAALAEIGALRSGAEAA
jgi:hypothetical protein